MFLKILILMICFSTSFLTYAKMGAGSGGGGVVWTCGRGFIKAPKVYLADVAEYKLHDFDSVLQYVSDINVGTKYVADSLNEQIPGLGSDVIERINHFLKFKGVMNQLELLNDDGLPSEKIIKGVNCKKEQLAIQILSTGVVTYNLYLYNLLSDEDKILFRIHEGLVSLQKIKFGTTAPIREEVLNASKSEVINKVIDKQIRQKPECDSTNEIDLEFQMLAGNRKFISILEGDEVNDVLATLGLYKEDVNIGLKILDECGSPASNMDSSNGSGTLHGTIHGKFFRVALAALNMSLKNKANFLHVKIKKNNEYCNQFLNQSFYQEQGMANEFYFRSDTDTCR